MHVVDEVVQKGRVGLSLEVWPEQRHLDNVGRVVGVPAARTRLNRPVLSVEDDLLPGVVRSALVLLMSADHEDAVIVQLLHFLNRHGESVRRIVVLVDKRLANLHERRLEGVVELEGGWDALLELWALDTLGSLCSAETERCVAMKHLF